MDRRASRTALARARGGATLEQEIVGGRQRLTEAPYNRFVDSQQPSLKLRLARQTAATVDSQLARMNWPGSRQFAGIKMESFHANHSGIDVAICF